MYNGINSSFDALRGKHDIFGSLAAGAVTGGLYKSTGMKFFSSYAGSFSMLLPTSAGVRPALAAATFMSGMAGVWSYVKKSV